MIDKLTQDLKISNAALEAHKQMLNETLQANLNMRTNLLIVEGMYRETKQELDNLKKEVETEKQLSESAE